MNAEDDAPRRGGGEPRKTWIQFPEERQKAKELARKLRNILEREEYEEVLDPIIENLRSHLIVKGQSEMMNQSAPSTALFYLGAEMGLRSLKSEMVKIIQDGEAAVKYEQTQAKKKQKKYEEQK